MNEKSPLVLERELLLLESALASESLGHGLTSLRQYNFSRKGPFFHSMISLATGLERLLKLTYIIHHVQNHNKLPTNKTLKSIGHDVEQLIEKAKEINETKSLQIDPTDLDDVICINIIQLLSKFARHSRYYNLDVLTGANRPGDEEPLAAWDRLVCTEIIQRHYRATKKHKDAIELAFIMSNTAGISVNHTLEDGSKIDNMLGLAKNINLMETKQKYSVLYTWKIVSFCTELLFKLDFLNPSPTYVYEYFRIFTHQSRSAVLKRKKWNPQP